MTRPELIAAVDRLRGYGSANYSKVTDDQLRATLDRDARRRKRLR